MSISGPNRATWIVPASSFRHTGVIDAQAQPMQIAEIYERALPITLQVICLDAQQ